MSESLSNRLNTNWSSYKLLVTAALPGQVESSVRGQLFSNLKITRNLLSTINKAP